MTSDLRGLERFGQRGQLSQGGQRRDLSNPRACEELLVLSS